MKSVLQTTKFLLPREGADLAAWAVVACDQFTSEAEYWKKLAEYVGDKPSALKIILPEIYLSEEGAERRIDETIKSEWQFLCGNAERAYPHCSQHALRKEADRTCRCDRSGRIRLCAGIGLARSGDGSDDRRAYSAAAENSQKCACRVFAYHAFIR